MDKEEGAEMVALGCATVVLMIRGVCLGARNLRKRGVSIMEASKEGYWLEQCA
jgi:hypothetical protein